ncbi:gamma-glutamylcyclotransferase [Billgrantia azerbaijanica]|nr:gamma-glutamylcyclotransferase [Halomonas azerbaijanica]
MTLNTPAMAIARTRLVAVYGTLKRGLRNHHWLDGAHFLGEDRLTAITLYDLGPCPGAKHEPSRGIEVEVFRVNLRQMADLDRLEGYHPPAPAHGDYDRAILTTHYGPAWVYLYNHDIADCPVIRQGGWPIGSKPAVG